MSFLHKSLWNWLLLLCIIAKDNVQLRKQLNAEPKLLYMKSDLPWHKYCLLFWRTLSIGRKKQGSESYQIHSKKESRKMHSKVQLTNTTFHYIHLHNLWNWWIPGRVVSWGPVYEIKIILKSIKNIKIWHTFSLSGTKEEKRKKHCKWNNMIWCRMMWFHFNFSFLW